MTFDIIVSDNPLSNTFSSTTLPADTALVSFSLNQPDLETLQVAADVSAFSSLAIDSGSVEFRVAKYLDTILPTATGDVSTTLGTLQAMETEAEVTAAYGELSPVSYRNFTRSVLTTTGLHVGAARDRLSAMRVGIGPVRASGQPLFLQSGGGNISLPGSASGASAYHRQAGGAWAVRLNSGIYRGGQNVEDPSVGLETSGLAVGMDRRSGDRTVLGASFSNTWGNLSFEDGLKDGLTRNYLWSAYAGHFLSDTTYLSSVLTFGRTESESLRAIALGSDLRKAHSDFSGDVLSAVAETGRVFTTGDWSTEAFGAVEYTSYYQEGFSETGASGVSLVVDSGRSRYLSTVTGLRLGRYFQSADGANIFMVQANAGWLHNYDLGANGITARFQGAGESRFTIDGEENPADGLRLGGAFTFMGTDRLDVSARVNADLYPDQNDVSGVMQVDWNY
jgi:uncharacterized protein with beta-barrel porin domain